MIGVATLLIALTMTIVAVIFTQKFLPSANPNDTFSDNREDQTIQEEETMEEESSVSSSARELPDDQAQAQTAIQLGKTLRLLGFVRELLGHKHPSFCTAVHLLFLLNRMTYYVRL